MVHHRATMMPYYYLEDQNEHFEYLINIQGPTETEKHPKMPGSSDFLWQKWEEKKSW